jgi:acyl-coenzyme A synthetase/AMP-(fatty) acid ligase
LCPLGFVSRQTKSNLTCICVSLLLTLAPCTAQWIIRHTLFGGLLTGATVVVVTKHPSVIQAAQLVVAMQHGRAVFTGSPSAYANWRAKQTATAAAAAAAAAGAVSNGWTPLIR